MQWLVNIPRNIAVGAIRLYQKVLSPDHSFWAKTIYPLGYCKYHPSCSEYGKQVMKKRGLLIGTLKATWRILRCNPWSKGGIDLPK